MLEKSIYPSELVKSLWANRRLLADMAHRDAVGRYKGSVLGVAWAFFTPIIMLSIYTFVFVHVFKARWPGAGDSSAEFSLLLFTGLILFNLFSECISRSTGVILANANFVKKVIFPLEILPCVTLVSALFHSAISLSILLAFELWVKGAIPLRAILLPVVVLPMMMMTIGLSWTIAAVGVYLRDLAQTIGLIMSGLMFMSPIFFPISAFPERLRFILELNPLAFPIEQSRILLLGTADVSWLLWFVHLLIGLASVRDHPPG